MELKKLTYHKVTVLPTVLLPDALYYIKSNNQYIDYVITDENANPFSIINDERIQRLVLPYDDTVAPAAGQTLIFNGNNFIPSIQGSGLGDVLSTNNLSDLENTEIARTNLDVYSKLEVDNLIPLETLTSLSLATNTLSYVDELGVTTNIDLSLYIDDTNLARLVSATVDPITGIATFNRDDASTFLVDFSALLNNVIVNDTLLSTSTTEALSANQGKILQDTKADISHTHQANQITDFSAEVSNNTDVISNTAKRSYPLTDENKLAGIENNATADQTGVEIETAYNAEVAEASQVEAEAGTEVAVRRWSPVRVAQAIAALGGGGSSGPVRQYLAADVVVTGSTTTTVSDLSITIPTGFSLVWSFFGRCNGSVANDFIVQAFPLGGTMDYGDVLVIWGGGRISGRPGGFGISFVAKGDNDDEVVTMTGGTFPNTTGQDGQLGFRYSQRIFSTETTATLRKGAYVEYELIPN